MNLKRKLIFCSLLVGAVFVLAGCGGVNGSHSVSPASFLLPGLIHHVPAENDIETFSESESIVKNDSVEVFDNRI